MKEGKMLQLTVWRYKEHMIFTQYGQIKWYEYLVLEAERINKDPSRRAEIRSGYPKNYLALFVNELEKELPNEA